MTEPELTLDGVKRLVGGELNAQVDISEVMQEMIIVPSYADEPPVYVAQPKAVVLPFSVSSSELGRAVRDALLACRPVDWNDSYARNPTMDTYPGYVTSRAAGRRDLWKTYVWLNVLTEGAEVKIEAHPIDSDEAVMVTGWADEPSSDEKLGEAVLLVFRCCQHLTRAEFS